MTTSFSHWTPKRIREVFDDAKLTIPQLVRMTGRSVVEIRAILLCEVK